MHRSEDPLDPLRRHALELAMREALGGMEELSLVVACAHLGYALQIVREDAPAAEALTPVAPVIPFPRARRACGG